MRKPIGPLFPVLLLWFLNMVDAICSLTYIDNVVMREDNPLMAWLLDIGPWAFLTYKVGLITVLCYLIYRFWSLRRWIPAATGFLILVYTWLLGYWTAGIHIMR